MTFQFHQSMIETHVVDKAQTGGTSVEVATFPVTPAQASDDGRQDEAKHEDQVDVVLVLPPDDLVLAKIADVRNTGLATGLDEHPADMRVPETLVGVVRVEVGVGVTMVSAVTTRPPLDGTLNGTGAGHGQEVL
jgi:hypothetical protein